MNKNSSDTKQLHGDTKQRQTTCLCLLQSGYLAPLLRGRAYFTCLCPGAHFLIICLCLLVPLQGQMGMREKWLDMHWADDREAPLSGLHFIKGLI